MWHFPFSNITLNHFAKALSFLNERSLACIHNGLRNLENPTIEEQKHE
jgi:hypothetical protein